MSVHDRALDLAAVAIDFDLTEEERAELEGHLDACVSCSRAATGMRYDAIALTRLPKADAPESVTRAISLGRRQRRMSGFALAATTIGGIALAIGVLAGSGGRMSGPDSGAAATTPPTPEAASAPPSATNSPTPTRSPVPGASVLPSIEIGSVVDVLVDSLRVRTRPDRTDQSLRLAPFLSFPRQVVVFDGPVQASDYDWYLVAPLDLATDFRPIDGDGTGSQAWGWVASASREGHPWIWPSASQCPSAPTDVQALAALEGLTGLVCFGGLPITFPAVLTSDPCPDSRSAISDPSWFMTRAGALFPPGGQADGECGYALHLDPNASITGDAGSLYGSDVMVTGVFDHPSARTCSFRDADGVTTPSPAGAIPCRSVFAVVSLESKEP